MNTYTVCAAFYDCDTRATVQVAADSYQEACEKAIALVDNGEVTTESRSWDPGPTFVYGVVEGAGDPWNGTGNVPFALSEEGATLPERFAKALAFAEQVARLETWRDCVTRICGEEGVTDPMEIENRIQQEQTDLDYLTSQDEALERLIRQARAIVGVEGEE
ncbi:hypothetical protein V3589_11390 [Sinorhizobium fredii]|uniref:hypothetical protein n=1 Tax=Rhizobium fredii TaxID=380 RepID=UPI0030B723C4